MKKNTAAKKTGALFIAFLMLCINLSIPALAQNALPVGSGTFADPYIVSEADELLALSELESVGYVQLSDDVDLTEFSGSSVIKKLTGDFNGKGHKITGLTLSGGSGSFATSINTGLIGELSGSVRNLIVENATVSNIANYNSVGILAGSIVRPDTDNVEEYEIDNCVVSGSITAENGGSGTFMGGLGGKVSGNIDTPTKVKVNNCVADVDIVGYSSTYVGGAFGSVQYYSTTDFNKTALLGNLSGKGNSGGMIGYVNSGSAEVNSADTYIGGQIKGSKQFGVAYNISSFANEFTNTYYDSEKNPNASSWDLFKLVNKGSVSVEDKTTEGIKALSIDGFEVREGFDGYPVPVWTESDTKEPPAPKFSCKVKFEGTEDGTILLYKTGDSENPISEDNGVYTLKEKGEYTYAVTDITGYENTSGSFTVGDGDIGITKTIWVHLSYKTVDLTGEGTEENPYLISTGSELYSLAALVNDGEKNDAFVKLENDITTIGSWTPLGKNTVYAFKGVFDGNGHSVTVTVDDPNLSYFGFFGCIDGATVKNLTVNGEIYCSEPSAYVGGISGRARGNAVIENCVNNANVSALARGGASIGGLVGGYDDGVEYVSENIRLEIKDSKNNGAVVATGADGDVYIGGIVGANQNCVQLTSCENSGSIYAPGAYVGGLLGNVGSTTGDYNTQITDCLSNGVLVGGENKTNRLFGHGTISEENIKNSGNNTYDGGSVTDNALLAEAEKYLDVTLTPAKASVGYKIVLLKSGETADSNIAAEWGFGEYDTNAGYISYTDSGIELAKINDTGSVVKETLTLKLTDKNGNSIRKPITVNVYPSDENGSPRKTLMNKIAVSYKGVWDGWTVFDMAVYEKLGLGKNTTNIENYLNLTINALPDSKTSDSDRAKAEIILGSLGIDSTKLTPVEGEEYSNAKMLQNSENVKTTPYFTAPFILLAEQAGQVQLSDEQRQAVIDVLIAAQSSSGVLGSEWWGTFYDDLDTTGAALAALAEYKSDDRVRECIEKAVEGLSKKQGNNGSYGNANTDAMVITGLAALGINPETDYRFVKGGGSLADGLMLNATKNLDGFTSPYDSGANGEKINAMATEQGFRALITLEAMENASAFNVYTQEKDGKNINGEVPKKEYIATGMGDPNLKPEPDEGEGESGGGSNLGKTYTLTVTVKNDKGEKWLSGTSVTVEKGATAAEVLSKAFSKAGITAEGIDDGYISSVTKDGKTLAQFDNGPNSGWMYKLNGEAATVGISQCKVSDGDEIELYYTNDYTKDESSKNWSTSLSGSSTSSSSDDVKVSFETNGGSSVKTQSLEKNSKAVLPEVPTKDGFKFVGWYSDKDCTKKYDFSAKVTKDITLYAKWEKTEENTENKVLFGDVKENDWYFESVKFAVEKGFMIGITEDKFQPDGIITRAEFVTILYRLENTPETEGHKFTDVKSGVWYDDAVAWASEKGIVNGVTEKDFCPTDCVTREQMAAILYRYAEFKGYDLSATENTDLSIYEDVNEISPYAVSAVKYAVGNELVKGKTEKTLNPKDNCTRAEAATVMMRFITNLG